MDEGKSMRELPKLLDRAGNKTCAKFVNGVRVGFGFVFERTCAPHSCMGTCDHAGQGPACRIFDFIRHNEVTLRTKESVVAESVTLGRVSSN
jgi:hypothetical protein